jgi:hypothetical protein
MIGAGGYSSWANCGLGSTVTTEDSKEIAPGMTMISSTSMTLCAVHPDKVVLDMVVRNRVQGGPVEFPPTEILQEVEIPAHPEPLKESSFESYSESNEDGSWGIAETSAIPWFGSGPDARQGDDTLMIAGQAVPCHWTERRFDQGGHRMTHTTWISDRIPGGIARVRTVVEGEAVQETTMQVTAFEKKPPSP